MDFHFHGYKTIKNYPYLLAIINKDMYVIKEFDGINYKFMKSLTNNMEEVLEDIFRKLNIVEIRNANIYQYDDDGLFKLTYNYNLMQISNIKWEYISNDITAFKLLYCK